MNKHHKSLELDKVLERLSEKVQSDDGKRAALEITPLNDLAAVKNEIQKTKECYDMISIYRQPSFGSLKNVNNFLALSNAGSVLSAGQLLQIAENLRVIRALSEWRRNQSQEKTLAVDIYFSSLRPNKYLEELITNAIISPEEISDNASPNLREIRRKLKTQAGKIRDKLDNIIHSSTYQKYLQDSLVTLRNGRYVVPVKAEFRSQVPGLVHDTSASGSTLFVEPMGVVDANNEINVLKGKEKDEIERILTALSAQVAEDSNNIKYGFENAVELDVIFAKASLAYDMRATEPILNNCGRIRLNNARHPLLNPDTVQPISLSLGIDFDTLVITGPNTGGKTVSIKTVGLITLMAMCGLMIPAGDESEIAVFDNIFADIGDEQSIEQSLSTFSSHMVNICDIMKNCDDNSLVLIDELGAGTDPVEGAALAQSIIEYFRSCGCKIAATTHYAEIKAFALSTDGVENGSCEFDVTTLTPTYRLLIGVPGRSNAFAISERLGIPHEVVDRSRELVSAENSKFEDVVDNLERSRLELERERRDAERISKEAADDRALAGKILENAQKQYDSAVRDAKSQAMKIVDNSRRKADELMLEITQIKKQMKNINQDALIDAKSKLKRKTNDLLDAFEPSSDTHLTGPDRPLVVGDEVKIAGTTSTATVTKILGSGRVEIQTGNIKMRVDEKQCTIVKKQKKQAAATVGRKLESRLNASSDNRCDLRGMNVEEAIPTLDLFLDSMTVTNINEVTIIHGKGTGVLRKAVQNHLKNHPQIKEFRLGVYGEGEDGVTIAKLK